MEQLLAAYLAGKNLREAARETGYALKTEGVGYYVYLLIDPRDGAVFYVGKGKGGRMHAHEAEVKACRAPMGPKATRIASILRSGFRVDAVVLVDGLAEPDAYRTEKGWITALADHGLTNISGGHLWGKELAQAKAQDLLSRIRPFAEWIQTPMARSREVAAVFGSPEAAYLRMVDALVAEVQDPTPRTITFTPGKQPVYGY